MKISIFILAVFFQFTASAQVEKVEVPKGVVYNYCDTAVYAKAKEIVTRELSATPSYSMNHGILFIGPVLWARYSKVSELNAIKGGDMTIRGYKESTSQGKVTQRQEDFNKVWDNIRKESAGGFTLRKATAQELRYYWSVISFDIDEPLIIVETKEFKLMWLDEAPRG